MKWDYGWNNALICKLRARTDKEPKQYSLNIAMEKGKMVIEVQFNCPNIQRPFNDIYEGGVVRSVQNIVSQKETVTDFINKVDNFIETEVVRIKRNEKLNKLLSSRSSLLNKKD